MPVFEISDSADAWLFWKKLLEDACVSPLIEVPAWMILADLELANIARAAQCGFPTLPASRPGFRKLRRQPAQAKAVSQI